MRPMSSFRLPTTQAGPDTPLLATGGTDLRAVIASDYSAIRSRCLRLGTAFAPCVFRRNVVLDDFNPYSTRAEHPTLRRLAHSVTFVRVMVVVGWISMVAIVALLALTLGGSFPG